MMELFEFLTKVASSTPEKKLSDTLHCFTVVDLCCQFDDKLQHDGESL